MKKFMKVSLVTAGILAAVGFVFCLIGGLVSGGNLIASIKNDAYMERRLGAVEKVIAGVEKGLDASKSGNISYHTQNSSEGDSGNLTVNDSTAVTGADEYHIETADVRELHLSLGAGNFMISEKDEADSLIDLYVSGKGDVDFFIKEHTLYVEGFKGNHLIGINELDNNITLRIPKGMGFDEVELEIGAGIMDICNMKARELDAVIGAGELAIENGEFVDFSAEIGAGHLAAGGMKVWEADLEVGLGNCSFEGSIEESLDAECSMGNMDFLLKGREEDYNYEIECSAGTVDLNGYEFSGLGGEKYVNNGSVSTFELSCSMGSITLNFQGE